MTTNEYSGNIIKVIKQIALQAYQAAKPADLILGTIDSLDPLKVMVSEKLRLSEAFLLIPHQVKILIKSGELKKGDTVVMLMQAGGQRYLLIDKVE
ncbi:hypothetical protein CXIVA_01670 [Clostridium sp. SY8519]|uniref:DUF2577 family protein n=1 Tax=Clostridium sp. (strain SY8519) TaxID=1042156 RepID=UPI0002171F6D|nr:DUF2577 family protein [Clostridium sp. SY8519]BAK46134.1 hypothetical protein CXIVA_01670 [Clostridium sp. SY8519]